MTDLSVAVKIGAEDRFSSPAAKVGGAASKLEKRVSAAKAELGALGKQRGTVDSLARLDQRLGKSGTALDAARKRTATLRGELRATASPTKKLSDAFQIPRNGWSRFRFGNCSCLIHDANSDRNFVKSLPRALALSTSRLNRDDRTAASTSNVEIPEQIFRGVEASPLAPR